MFLPHNSHPPVPPNHCPRMPAPCSSITILTQQFPPTTVRPGQLPVPLSQFSPTSSPQPLSAQASSLFLYYNSHTAVPPAISDKTSSLFLSLNFHTAIPPNHCPPTPAPCSSFKIPTQQFHQDCPPRQAPVPLPQLSHSNTPQHCPPGTVNCSSLTIIIQQFPQRLSAQASFLFLCHNSHPTVHLKHGPTRLNLCFSLTILTLQFPPNTLRPG